VRDIVPKIGSGRELLKESADGRFCGFLRAISSRFGLKGFPSQIYVMLGISVLFSFARNIAFPYLSMYLTGELVEGGLGIDESLVGLLIMVGGLGYTFALLVTGSLCDKFGRRKMMLAFIVPQVVLTASYAFARTYLEFFCIYVVGGILGAFYDPAFNAMIADLVRAERREEVYGLSYMISNIGTVLGPPIGGVIASISGYPVLFIYASILTVVSAVIILVKIEESYSGSSSSSVTLGQLVEVFKHRLFILFCFLGALTNIVYTQLYGLLSVYTEYIGFEPYVFGALFSINGAMVVLLQIPIRKGAMKVGSTKAFIIAQIFYSVGFTYFMISRSFAHILVGVVVLTIGEIIFFPALTGFVANLSPSDKRGRYMALTGLFFGIGGSVGSLIGFRLYDILLDKAMVWGFLGIIGFATLPGYVYLLNAVRRTESTRVSLANSG
jgi:MFS family permease